MDWHRSIFPDNISKVFRKSRKFCEKCGKLIRVNSDEVDEDICNCRYQRSLERSYEFNFLKKDSCKNMSFFNLNGIETWGKIVNIYDGDTCHVVLLLDKKPYKFRVRLANIDTAEKNSADPREAAWAVRAIERFQSLISHNPIVWISCHNFDKYGRLLADLFPVDVETNRVIQDQSINDILLHDLLAYRYDGSKRKSFVDWAPKEALFSFD